MTLNFASRLHFSQASKTIIFHNTNLSDMRSLSKFDHQVAPLRKLSLIKLLM